MMRGVTIKLPEIACSKLEALEFSCDAALEAARAAANRLAGLPRDADVSLFVQASKPSGEWVHRNYLAK